MKILEALINKRFDFVYGDAHGVAHVLDPRFCGAQMDTETRSRVEEFITEWRGINKEQGEATADAVVIELVRFQRFTAELKVKAQRMWTQLKNGKLAVYDFWCPLKQFSLLQDIAKQVFPCTAGKRVEKLVHIYFNVRNIQDEDIEVYTELDDVLRLIDEDENDESNNPDENFVYE
ncbi:hypothetical protein F441_14734 [Phytophthora nicotianae CJ01A1]|uniref:HAT C-terminal dimerisation domain-containing protein n=1 Tax=Phytophthora nicotianae CJ01A1 TaxID=1317063 RepID=W2WFY1_PHYNI|nr:hypothetical protein F441_14734 [Phytophthora nicotianae CJ01A1]